MINKDIALMTLLTGENYRYRNQDLYDLVSNKIYPVPIPEDVSYPAISHIEISGNKKSIVPFAGPREQFNIYVENIDGNGYYVAKEIFEALNTALNKFKGLIGDVKIKQIAYENDFPRYDDNLRLYTWVAEYYIFFQNEEV